MQPLDGDEDEADGFTGEMNAQPTGRWMSVVVQGDTSDIAITD